MELNIKLQQREGKFGKGVSKQRTKGEAIDYDELKKQHLIAVTDVAWEALGQLADQLQTSRSEVIEQFARSATAVR